jgi:tRNA-2-methylthio-N6-dimethylallyladenosine synthase
MIRRYTRAEYTTRVRRLLAARPDMTISTDVIVGFPGETAEEFEATLDLVRDIGFTGVFGFKYSQRPFTPALKLVDDVPEQEKSERLARLFEVAESQIRAHLATLVGTRQSVLVEGPSKGGANLVEGRTDKNEIVHVEAPHGRAIVGEVVEVEVERANKHSLVATLTPDAVSKLPALADAPPFASRRRRALPLAG